MIFQPLCDLKPPGGRASAPLRNQELVSRRTHPTVDGPPTIGCRDPPAVHQILPLVVRTEPGETVGLPAAPYARGCPRGGYPEWIGDFVQGLRMKKGVQQT